MAGLELKLTCLKLKQEALTALLPHPARMHTQSKVHPEQLHSADLISFHPGSIIIILITIVLVLQ